MAVTTTSNLSSDTTAYNRLAWFSLRPQLVFDDVATVGTTPFTHKGASVVFNFQGDLTPATTALTEGTDVTPTTLSDSQVTVTLAEQGATVNTTAKIRHTSYIELDPVIANVVGFWAGISQDTLALNELNNGTNVDFQSTATSRVTTTAAMVMTSDAVRKEKAKLSAAFVQPIPGRGPLYRSYIHGDIAYDLKRETGDIGWRQPQAYSDKANIAMSTLGIYEGFEFVENPRCSIFTDTGAGGTVDVYGTYWVGDQALAKAFTTGTHLNGSQMGPEPIVVPGPIVDSLYRQVPMGWYWFGAYKVFRQAALRRTECASSIGAN